MYCKDCKYWKRNNGEWLYQEIRSYGSCNHGKLDTCYDFDIDATNETEIDKLVSESNGEYTIMQTGENFGCIHFTK